MSDRIGRTVGAVAVVAALLMSALPAGANGLSVPGKPDTPPGVAPGNRNAQIATSIGSGADFDAVKVQCESGTGVDRTRTFDGTPGQVMMYWLTAGADYRCRNRWHNPAGWGPFSDFSGYVTVLGPPDAPEITDAQGDVRMMVLSVTAPDTNGSAITAYKAQCSSDETEPHVRRRVLKPFDQVVVPYLRGDTYYSCELRARNEYGWGPWSTIAGDTVLPGVFSLGDD